MAKPSDTKPAVIIARFSIIASRAFFEALALASGVAAMVAC